MKHTFITALFLMILFVSGFTLFQHHPIHSDSDSLTIKVRALDLSEDWSRMSSQNDELVFLIYPMTDSIHLGQVLIKKYIQLTDSNRTFQQSLSLAPFSVESKLLLFMIELDNERSIDVIDSIVSNNHVALLNAFRNKNYIEIEKYLGDDDVLGYRIINRRSNARVMIFNMKGIYRLDKYDYLFQVTYD